MYSHPTALMPVLISKEQAITTGNDTINGIRFFTHIAQGAFRTTVYCTTHKTGTSAKSPVLHGKILQQGLGRGVHKAAAVSAVRTRRGLVVLRRLKRDEVLGR